MVQALDQVVEPDRDQAAAVGAGPAQVVVQAVVAAPAADQEVAAAVAVGPAVARDRAAVPDQVPARERELVPAAVQGDRAVDRVAAVAHQVQAAAVNPDQVREKRQVPARAAVRDRAPAADPDRDLELDQAVVRAAEPVPAQVRAQAAEPARAPAPHQARAALVSQVPARAVAAVRVVAACPRGCGWRSTASGICCWPPAVLASSVRAGRLSNLVIMTDRSSCSRAIDDRNETHGGDQQATQALSSSA